jgi:hypothetical protein
MSPNDVMGWVFAILAVLLVVVVILWVAGVINVQG